MTLLFRYVGVLLLKLALVCFLGALAGLALVLFFGGLIVG